MPEDMEVDEVPTTVNQNGIPEYEEIVVPPAPQSALSFDDNGPRLMITQIVNENFKSYAGVQTLGPFHKSFSSIVGPNGSGKSNVIDSMLFVFGFRSSKIRSKKVSVLIHSSSQHKNLDRCKVSVHFQKIIDNGPGDDDYTVVPDSKFVVSRIANRDSSSEYHVNDRKVTFKEVASLLRGSGIDLDHNRFLILQGEVEQIAMMKPKAPSEHEDGMLEFLEDIIGSSRFKEPIEKLTKRVEELNELRGEKLNRVKGVEKEKDDLEGAKNEAVEYLGVENDVVKRKHLLFQKYLMECTDCEKKAVEKRDEINVELQQLNKKLSEIEDAKKLRVQDSKKTYKKYEELSKECELKKEEFSKYEQQDVHFREDIKHARAERKKLEKSLEQEEKKLEELKSVPGKQEKEMSELQKNLDKLQEDKLTEEEKLKEAMESFKTETEGLQKEKEVKEKELITLQEKVNETKSQFSLAQSELDLYQSNLNKETAKWKETQKTLETVTATLQERRRNIEDLEKNIPDTERALEKSKKDLADVIVAEQKTDTELKDIQSCVNVARNNKNAAQNQSNVLKVIMQQKNNGNLPGVYGRLGDLGAIDKKYDVAISSACPGLDNILCDSIDTCQKCVEFLKQTGNGKGTFIGLDKVQHFKERCFKKIQTPENVHRLFDLVTVKDEKLLPAFYHCLRDALVANDIPQASRIAKLPQRYRVVTLDGEIYEPSGTMTGGGSRVFKGKMGSSVVEDVNPKDVENLQTQLRIKTQEYNTCHENRIKLEEMVDRLQKNVEEMHRKHKMFTNEIKTLSKNEESLKQYCKEQEESVKAAALDKKQLEQLENKVTSFKKVFEKAQGASAKVEDVVQSLHKQIMDIGGTKLKAVESRLNLINSQIDQQSKLLTKAGVAIKTAERNMHKAEEKIETLKKDIVKNHDNIEKLEKALQQLDDNATDVLEAYKKAQEAIKQIEASLAEVNAAVTKLEEEETSVRKDHIEIQHRFEKYDSVVKENRDKIKHWKKELDRLTLHKIPGEEQGTLNLLTMEELEKTDTKNTQYEITVAEEKLAKMKPNMAAIAEYQKKEDMYLKKVAELDQVTELRNNQRKLHDDLRKQRLDEFMSSFGIITNKLKEMYQMITLGGDAELELVDSLDPFSEGIVFSVRPPKKSWKNISNLSGGEKTLSSLALVFALHHYKPTPLYVMDEIDAALDFKNVSIVANYIRERTRNAQFIIISLRNNMFELADRLIGIFKTNNCTKSVTINPHRLCLPGNLGDEVAPVDHSAVGGVDR